MYINNHYEVTNTPRDSPVKNNIMCSAKVYIKKSTTQETLPLECSGFGLQRYKIERKTYGYCLYCKSSKQGDVVLRVNLSSIPAGATTFKSPSPRSELYTLTINSATCVTGNTIYIGAKIDFAFFSMKDADCIDFFTRCVSNFREYSKNHGKQIPAIAENPFAGRRREKQIARNKKKQRLPLGFSPTNTLPLMSSLEDIKSPVKKRKVVGGTGSKRGRDMMVAGANKRMLKKKTTILLDSNNRYRLPVKNGGITGGVFYGGSSTVTTPPTRRVNPRYHRLSLSGDSDSNVAEALRLSRESYVQDRKKRGELRGFRNVSNTCYLNATIQALLSCKVFSNQLYDGRFTKQIENDGKHKNTFYLSIVDVMRKRKSGNVNVLDLKWLKESISSKYKRFAGNDQEDAHEFTKQCINQVNDEILEVNGLLKRNSDNSTEDETQAQWLKKQSELLIQSPSVMAFRSQLKHIIQCINPKCTYAREIIEEFYDYSLNMVPKKLASTKQENKIHEIDVDDDDDFIVPKMSKPKTFASENAKRDCDRRGCTGTLNTVVNPQDSLKIGMIVCSNLQCDMGKRCNVCESRCSFNHETHMYFCSVCKWQWARHEFRRANNNKATPPRKITTTKASSSSSSSSPPLPQPPPSKDISIVDVFRDFFEPHILDDYKCEKCNEIGAGMMSTFYELPNVLLLHLKRFRPNFDTQTYDKLRNPVEITEEINVVNLCDSETLRPANMNNNNNVENETIHTNTNGVRKNLDDDFNVASSPSSKRQTNELDVLKRKLENETNPAKREQLEIEWACKVSELEDASSSPTKRNGAVTPVDDDDFDEWNVDSAFNTKPLPSPMKKHKTSNNNNDDDAMRRIMLESKLEHEKQLKEDEELQRAITASLLEAKNAGIINTDDDDDDTTLPPPSPPPPPSPDAIIVDDDDDAEEEEEASRIVFGQRSPCNINAKYKLRAIIHHRGRTAEHGHYVTDIQADNGKWSRYDDAFVKKIEKNDALGAKSARTSYLLFYELQNK